MVDLKAEIIDSANLRIVLSAEELEQGGITFASLHERSPKARAFLLALSRAAGLLLQSDTAEKSLHIEAYPYADGGCLLCVSCEAPRAAVSLLFTDSFDSLTALCTELAPYCSAGKSRLYRTDAGFFLLTDRETAGIALSTRHAVFSQEAEAIQAILSEYAELLIGEDAVKRLAAFDVTPAEAYGPSSSDPDC